MHFFQLNSPLGENGHQVKQTGDLMLSGSLVLSNGINGTITGLHSLTLKKTVQWLSHRMTLHSEYSAG